MAGIWTMGEILVEVMRPTPGMRLDQPGPFIGPFPSGAPAIFIDTVARLGKPAGIIGGVGADDFGKCVLDRLQQDGVNCHYVAQVADRSTAVAFVTYFLDGSRQFIFHIDGTPAAMTRFTGTEDLGKPDFFHIMGCSLMVNDFFRENIYSAMRACQKEGAAVSFDPNIRAELLQGRSLEDLVQPVLEACSILIPGTAELALLSGEAALEDGVRCMFARYALELIVLKRGKQGCSVFHRDGRLAEVPAFQVEEVDPTGAGDCFDAAFLCGILDGYPLEECARRAAAAGALNTAAFGPMEGQITPQAVAKLIAEAGV